VTAGQERRLPVLDVVVENVRKHQVCTRQRYPETPIADLRLFPRASMNPHGYHAMGSSLFGETLRKWVDVLLRLDSTEINRDGQPLPFDRSQISGYSFRHTYAQRLADAGVAVDVLKDLMDHNSIDTTMGYYNPRELHQMRAFSQVA
jgi:integrase